MKFWKTAALSAALLGAAGAGAAMTPVHGQDRPRPAARVDVFGAGGGRIGVSVADLEAGDTRGSTGVLIDSVVEDSPAEKAGLRKGDIVVEFDGERVRSVRQFTRLVSETPAGRQVAAAVMRDGQRVSLSITPRESSSLRIFGDGSSSIEALRDYARTIPPIPARPALPRPPSAPRAPRPPALEQFFLSANPLGVTANELSDQLAEYFGTKGGVLVTSVSEDSAAMKAGVKAGDVIVSVNGSSVENTGDLRERMRRLDAGDEFTLDIVRDRKSMTLKGKAEAPATRRWTTRTIL
jgi:serine protease Do